MAPMLPNISKPLSTCPLAIVALIAIAVLLPLPVSAASIPPYDPPSELPPPTTSNPSSSGMSNKVIFDIVFGLGAFILAMAAFSYVGSWNPFTWSIGVVDRMCDASYYLMQKLSAFRLSTFLAGAGNPIAATNDANVAPVSNESTEVRSVPIVPRPAPVQSFWHSWVPIFPGIIISARHLTPQTGPTASA